VDLARVAQIILKGYIPSRYKEKGKEFDIRVIMREADRDTYEKLYNIKVNSPARGLMPIGSVVKFEKGVGPSEIKRIEQERTITVSANVTGRKLANILADVEKMIGGLNIKMGYRVRLAGESEEMKASFNSLQFALVLSLVLVYMIMAAQFESIIQPIIILATVPMSIIGVMFSLFATNTSISVVSIIVVVVLGGVVVNNGIVLIDFINLLMREGMEIVEAIIKAARSRLRPILMTALTTILGLVPMAVTRGRGSELRAPMAISIMGGLTVATFLTLVIIPSIFLWEHEFRAKISTGFRKKG
jgi:HAE1 family hydrophobic/amphiphilic exporter-1